MMVVMVVVVSEVGTKVVGKCVKCTSVHQCTSLLPLLLMVISELWWSLVKQV